MIRIISAVFCLLALCIPAHAAEWSASSTDWAVNKNVVRLGITLPRDMAARAVASDGDLSVQTIAKYVISHVAASSDAGACVASDQGYDIGTIDILAPTAAALRFEVFFDCPGPAGIVIHNGLLFAQAPAHIDFARVQIGGKDPIEMVFRRDKQNIALPRTGDLAASNPLADYMAIGIRHVVSSGMRICFALALLLVLRNRKDLLSCLAMLALGYGTSALLAITGRYVPDLAVAGALSSFPLLLVTIEILVARTGSTRAIAFASLLIASAIAIFPIFGRQWTSVLAILGAGLLASSYTAIAGPFQGRRAPGMVPALLFGFLDGIGFLPAILAVLPSLHIVGLVAIAIDCGAFLAGAVGLFVLFYLLWAIPKARRQPAPIFRDLAAAALAGLGLFWVSNAFWS